MWISKVGLGGVMRLGVFGKVWGFQHLSVTSKQVKRKQIKNKIFQCWLIGAFSSKFEFNIKDQMLIKC